MDEMTALDLAHEAMQAAPEDEAPRLRFYAELGNTMLHLLLEAEPEEDRARPRTFAVEGAEYVLAFDGEDRLAGFTRAPAPHLSLPGRALAVTLAEEGLGLALNPEVAPSSILLPPEAMAWLAGVINAAPDTTERRPLEVFPPAGIPDGLLSVLDARLARMAGLAERAYLAGVRHEDGTTGHLLGIVGAVPDARPALARAVSEALALSGVEAAALDVGFPEFDAPITALLARHGLRFDIPPADGADGPAGPSAPGMNPQKPPIIR